MISSSEDAIRVTYLIETPLPVAEAARKVADFLSAGTFTPLTTADSSLIEPFQAQVMEIKERESVSEPSLPWKIPPSSASQEYRRAEIVVAVPVNTPGTQLTGLLATVSGSVYGLNEVSGARLRDLEFPEPFIRSHPGPQFGIEGTRRLTSVEDRPIIASIIKPNVGLKPEMTAGIVEQLVEGGVDFIKDDEKMTDPPYNTFEERVKAVMKVIRSYAERAGRQPMFAFNVSDDNAEEMVRKHDLVLEAGGTCIMVSINQVGLGGVHFLRRRSQLPIHAHRNGWAMLTRHPLLGLDFRAYQKIWRLVGVDHLHVNGIRNKFWESDESVVNSIEACLTPLADQKDRVLPVVGSGMWAEQVPDTYKRTRTVDFMYIAGGGIQGHPDGPGAGVRSIRQAWQAAREGTSLDEFARDHEELRRALETFTKAKK